MVSYWIPSEEMPPGFYLLERYVALSGTFRYTNNPDPLDCGCAIDSASTIHVQEKCFSCQFEQEKLDRD
jgi:hypothetical protein